MAEQAKGIPDLKDFTPPREARGEMWEYVLHKHDAERAKKHHDLRLGDPTTGRGHSWAFRRFPTPGEKILAVEQPVHTLGYFDFSGKIDSGYGKGEVAIEDRGKAQVLLSSPNLITFNRHSGKGSEEFALVRTDKKNWLLINRTPTKTSYPHIKQEKPSYKSISGSEYDPGVPGHLQPKIDAAHVLIDLQEGKRPRVFSYRPSTLSERLIQHTWRIPEIAQERVPKGIGHTILRAELYASDKKSGRVLPAQEQSAILNMNADKAREYISSRGLNLKAYAFDVEKSPRKFLGHSDKLKEIESISTRMPWIVSPETASDEKAKRALFGKIKAGKHLLTSEGAVLWPEQGKPTKVKLTKETEVYIKNIFPGEGKYRDQAAGGFEYSLHKGGPIVGRVGTGFSDEQRREMKRNPNEWVGRRAIIDALQQYSSGAFRAPAFKYLHDIGT